DVVMQVAVANVAEAVDVDLAEGLLQRGTGARDEVGDLRHRHRDVVLDVRELRFGNALADAPQGTRLVDTLRDRCLPLTARPRPRSPRAPRSGRVGSEAPTSGSRYRGCLAGRGSRVRGTCFRTASRQLRETSSKALIRSPSRERSSPSSSTAARGLSSAIQAV